MTCAMDFHRSFTHSSIIHARSLSMTNLTTITFAASSTIHCRKQDSRATQHLIGMSQTVVLMNSWARCRGCVPIGSNTVVLASGAQGEYPKFKICSYVNKFIQIAFSGRSTSTIYV